MAAEKPLRPTPGKLAAAIAELVDDMIQELGSNDTTPIENYLSMLKSSPIVGPACEVIALLGVARLGEYSHPDEEIQGFIRKSFEMMHGSLALSMSELLSVKPLGYAFSEWSIQSRPEGWMLDDIQVLHPEYYEFEGNRGGIKGVVYRGGGGTDVRIPYDRGIHIINQRHLSFRNPYGVADCRRAVSAWKAWRIVMNELLVASQRQATPIIVGYAEDEEVPLYAADNRTLLLNKETGLPVTVPAASAMMDQLVNLDNRSVLTTSTKNRIEALAQVDSGSFFFETLKMLQQIQLLAFLVPETILTATGVGDSNLNSGHRTTLDASIDSTVSQIKEQILEKPVRNLITWNYGEGRTDTLGSFDVPEEDSTDRVALLNALTSAVKGGEFLPRDLETVNKGRELAGIPPMDKLVESIASNGKVPVAA